MSFSELMRKVIVFLFHVLLITVPFVFTWTNEELFEFPKMLVVYGFTIVIVTAWLSRMIAEKKIGFRKTIFDIPLTIFLGSQVLSTLFSIHPHTSLFGYYTRFHGGLLSTISYVALYYAFVTNVSKSELKGFLKTLILSGLGVSLYAIPEHFGHSPSCALISGSFDVKCWVQDVQSRVFGTFGQPNWLAAYVITLLPLAMVLASTSKKISSLVVNVTVPALFLSLLFSRSRSGFGGFAVSMVLLAVGYLWLLVQKHGWQPDAWFTKPTKSFITAAVVLVGLLLIFGSPFTPSLSSLVASKTTSPSPTSIISPAPTASTPPVAPAPVNRLEEGGTDSGEIRKIVYEGAWKIWQRYPLFGSGVETFAYSYYLDRPLSHNLVSEWDFLYNKAHNEFLNYLATTGLVGFTAYCLLLGWFGWACGHLIISKKSSLTYPEKRTVLALLAGITALTISNSIGFSTVAVSVLLFLYMAFIDVVRRTDEVDITQTRKMSVEQKIMVAVVVVIGCGFINQVWAMWSADHNYYLGKTYFNAGYAIKGANLLQTASDSMPNEALYHDELSVSYAQLAVFYHQQQDATQAAQLASAAIQESDKALALNSHHLNFYKSRVRVCVLLAEIEPSFLSQAKTTLETAITLAPTDAKLFYNLGALQVELKQTPEATTTFQKTIAMKPNYEAARMELGKLYELKNDTAAAVEQYQYIYDHITQSNQFVNERLQQLKK